MPHLYSKTEGVWIRTCTLPKDPCSTPPYELKLSKQLRNRTLSQPHFHSHDKGRWSPYVGQSLTWQVDYDRLPGQDCVHCLGFTTDVLSGWGKEIHAVEVKRKLIVIWIFFRARCSSHVYHVTFLDEKFMQKTVIHFTFLNKQYSHRRLTISSLLWTGFLLFKLNECFVEHRCLRSVWNVFSLIRTAGRQCVAVYWEAVRSLQSAAP